MSRLPIFTENNDGTLVPMRPAAPPNEDSLQDLTGRFPEIISGDGDALLLIQREKSVPDQSRGQHQSEPGLTQILDLFPGGRPNRRERDGPG